MALTVETGAIVAGAESYISVADADTYHSGRGNTAWAALATEAKEQALRKATAYLDGKYRGRFTGYKAYSSQTLQWPRYGALMDGWAVASSQIPQCLKDATCEAALRSLSASLAADKDTSIKRQKVDVIETEFIPGGRVEYREIDYLLSGLLRSSSEVVRG